jgi:hypothetical protein
MIEYKIIRMSQSLPEAEDQLNKLGEDGWELCWYTHGTLGVFKRDVASIPVTGQWNFQSTVSPPPPSGGVRFNNATQDNTTAIYLSVMNSGGTDVTPSLTTLLKAGKKLRITRDGNPTQFRVFNLVADASLITGLPNYYQCQVTLAESGGNISVGLVNISVE